MCGAGWFHFTHDIWFNVLRGFFWAIVKKVETRGCLVGFSLQPHCWLSRNPQHYGLEHFGTHCNMQQYKAMFEDPKLSIGTQVVTLSTELSPLSISARFGSRTDGPSFARSSAACRRSSSRNRRRRLELQRVQQRSPRQTSATPTPVRPLFFLRPTLLPLLLPPPPVTRKQPRSPNLERWAWKSTSPPLNRRTASQQQKITLTERRTIWEGTWGWRSGRRCRVEGLHSRRATRHPANGWTLHQVNIITT